MSIRGKRVSRNRENDRQSVIDKGRTPSTLLTYDQYVELSCSESQGLRVNADRKPDRHSSRSLLVRKTPTNEYRVPELTQPSRIRISKSLICFRKREIRHRRNVSESNMNTKNLKGSSVFSGSIAKRLELLRLNEELWHRHLRFLCRESLTWRNRPQFWQSQLRGLQKRDFFPLARVANGSFMKVFAVKAYNPPTPESRRVYALKIIERIDVQLEEIIKEFDVMLKLSHSHHFPNVYGFFFDRECYQMCFLMEFLDGVCLMTLTYAVLHPPKESRHQNFDRIAHYYAVELVRAVAYLHHKISVPHGDLKNDNIMITMSGQLKVFDFDYCGQYSIYHHSERYHRYDVRKNHAVQRYFKKEIRSLYPTNYSEADRYEDIFRVTNISRLREQERRLKVRALSGHRAYRSPEYHAMSKKGELISRRRAIMSDWWAVGVLVYELYMGIHPFAQKDPDNTYPRFRAMNVSDVINHRSHPPLKHSFMANKIGDTRVASFLKCLLADESERLGSKPMASDIRSKGLECGLYYFENEDAEPPYRPHILPIEEMATVDRNSIPHASKHYKLVSKDNKEYSKFPFLTFATL